MASIESPDDDTNGTVIGGNYGQAWVTYCGRKQGKICYPANEADAYSKCNEIVEAIRAECGEVFNEIYPLQKWVYHFYGV